MDMLLYGNGLRRERVETPRLRERVEAGEGGDSAIKTIMYLRA